MIHKHFLLTAFLSSPPTDEMIGRTWLTELVEKINMKVLVPAQAVYCDTPGNEGLTGFVVIETSHISFHCWMDWEGNKTDTPTPFIQVDVFSCAPFDPQTVVEHLGVFGPTFMSAVLLDRDPLNALVDVKKS